MRPDARAAAGGGAATAGPAVSAPASAALAAVPPPRYLALLLAAVTALGPFSIDTYLPSFADIGTSLAASALEVQQTLTAYLVPFAFMSLWHGAISDAFGRRRVLLAGLVLYLLATLAAVVAVDIGQLWLARAAQGLTAGSGIVIARAIIRDLHAGPEAQRLMAQVTMIFALAPAIAPIIGGFLQDWFGWRAVFAFLALFAALLLVVCVRWLPETLPPAQRQSLRPGSLLRAYAAAAGDRIFMAASTAVAFNFTGIFLYVLSAPIFLVEHLGLSAREFGWLFIPLTSGLMAGAWLSGRLAGRRSARRTIALGFVLMGAAATANLLTSLAAPAAWGWYIVFLPLYTTGMAVAMPSLTLLALDRFPARRGLASSVQGFVHTGFAALAAGLLVPLLWDSPRTLALGMAALLLAGLACARRTRPPADAGRQLFPLR